MPHRDPPTPSSPPRGGRDLSRRKNFETNSWGDMDEDTFTMSSFDWETNDCALTLVK